MVAQIGSEERPHTKMVYNHTSIIYKRGPPVSMVTVEGSIRRHELHRAEVKLISVMYRAE